MLTHIVNTRLNHIACIVDWYLKKVVMVRTIWALLSLRLITLLGTTERYAVLQGCRSQSVDVGLMPVIIRATPD